MSEPVSERFGRLCCNRRARPAPAAAPEPAPIEPDKAEEASAEVDSASDASKDPPEQPTMVDRPRRTEAETPDETGSSGYFSNSNSSRSDSEASDACFWKPQRLQSDSSAASATSSEFRQAEAQRAELEKLMAQVPTTETGKPMSLGSINHPSACSPCMFFTKPSGCIRGVQCEFCHFPHATVRKHMTSNIRTGSLGNSSRA
ncbi:unnamed protein product [Effrenium voratum]|uniref:C3H1-type domain-containing protein n=1 Tax=Effrenium voratum TaxID=2562239 RepID=A0AA36I4N2_9DINO|nr:unnamed protein product [Effrenium voratum]